MKKTVSVLMILIWGLIAFAQSEWKFQPNIEKNEFYLLEGKIDEKYPIKMYLEQTWDFCGAGNNNRWKARGLKGWYEYSKVGKKILLIGSIRGSDPDHFIKLFVPTNLLDTVNAETCELENYKEKFIAGSYQFSELKWKTNQMDTFYSVVLKPIHDFSWNTNVTIGLEIRGVEISEINLTELSKIEYIQSVEILAAKEVDNNFYAIIEFGHRTNPGSSGSGHCGAGYERYLGFLNINRRLELEKFEFHQTWSCINYIHEDKFTFNEEYPEKGIIQKQ